MTNMPPPAFKSSPLPRRTLMTAALALAGSSCYGQFALTKKLHAWNGSFGNKFLSTLLFWVFVLLPVYEVTLLVDAWILNLIEFWTGSNPLAMNENVDGSTTTLARLDETTVRLKRELNGATLEHFDIVLSEATLEIRSLTGATLVSGAVSEAGSLSLTVDGQTQVFGNDQLRLVELSPNKAMAALNLMPGVSIASR